MIIKESEKQKMRNSFIFIGLFLGALALSPVSQAQGRAGKPVYQENQSEEEVASTSQTGASVLFGVGNAMGTMGQNFSNGFSLDARLEIPPMLDDSLRNFISVGFANLPVRVDSNSAFRLIPILGGIEFPGKVYSDFYTTFSAAAGVGIGYLHVPNIVNFSVRGYFMVQLAPGFEWMLGDGFALIGRMNTNFVIGSTSLTFVNFGGGLKFNF